MEQAFEPVRQTVAQAFAKAAAGLAEARTRIQAGGGRRACLNGDTGNSAASNPDFHDPILWRTP
jgi:hypothetical protein